jgi:hypothetical protein
MSPHLMKVRTNPGNSQLTMESSNSRVGSSHGIPKPPMTKRSEKDYQSAKGNRRNSKVKVEPPQIISSSKKVNSSGELLDQSQSNISQKVNSSHNVDKSSSLNNLKDKKVKSALRSKEANSKLSEKVKKTSTAIKKSKDVKRMDSQAFNEEEKLQENLEVTHQRSRSADNKSDGKSP